MHPRLSELQNYQCSSFTKVIDVEDAADGTTRPAVLDLALCRRRWGVVDGGIDLAEAEGLGLGVCRHGWKEVIDGAGWWFGELTKLIDDSGGRRTSEQISRRLVRYTSLMEKFVRRRKKGNNRRTARGQSSRIRP